MKKLLCIVVTLSIVMTMLASVTAFAAAPTPLAWAEEEKTPQNTANLSNGVKQLKYSTNYPDGTKYTHESASYTATSDVTMIKFSIFGWWAITDYQTYPADSKISFDIVYSVDDDIAYWFVNNKFKGSAAKDGGKYRLSTASNRGLHSISWTGSVTYNNDYQQKAYDSNFSFSDLGLHAGTAIYNEAEGKYTISYEIARVRDARYVKLNKVGTTEKVSADLIGSHKVVDGFVHTGHNGMYIAGYDTNGMLLFVNNTTYQPANANKDTGKTWTVTSPVTAQADKIKLFIYDEMNYSVGSLTPAIEALEFNKIQ